MNLLFHMPTRVIMGEGCIRKNAGVLASLGQKALIVTGARSALANGSLDDVTAALTAEGREYAIYNKVMSNPTISCAYDGAAVARAEKADFIVAIGGGSPMDAAKAIALLASQDIPQEQLFSGKYKNEVLPMAFVPTTAGTGSEVTQYSILTNDKAMTKTSIATPLLFPAVTFLDAGYTMNLPAITTVNTAIDALSHSVEGMLSVKSSLITDLLAKDSIRCISKRFDSLMAGTLSYEDREKLLYASMLGGMVIAHTGTTAVHSMGYSLTFFKNIDHGRANGLLLAAFLDFVQERNRELVQSILAIMGYTTVSQLRETLSCLLGEKETVTAEELEKFTSIAITAKNIPNCVAMPTQQDLLDIYTKSFS